MAPSGNILGITGAFGYIGKRLMKRLEQDTEFERIVCVDIAPAPSDLPHRYEYRQCDIRDGEKLLSVFKQAGVTTVIHLAFIAYPTRDPQFEYNVDVKGTAHVLKACGKTGVKKLVVASSDCAYGFFEGTPDYLPENAPIRSTPGFPYSENKAEIEKLVAEFAGSNPSCQVVVLRPCIVMGPTCRSTTAKSMKDPVIVGVKGYDPIMQFVHEDDTAEAFYQVAVRNVSGAFNLAADEGLRYSELAKFLKKPFVALPPWLIYNLVEILFRLRIVPFGKAQIDYIRYPLSMDITKIKRELGFAPRYTSRETLRSFMDAV
ncbi:MAG: NAD-dependent epimerase/dehydratase family protein [Deltaproteobacteria bacterium]|nr:NAD-dependent epimerase/dehydratase family protein [Deltaproteobacteria bacterium]